MTSSTCSSLSTTTRAAMRAISTTGARRKSSATRPPAMGASACRCMMLSISGCSGRPGCALRSIRSFTAVNFPSLVHVSSAEERQEPALLLPPPRSRLIALMKRLVYLDNAATTPLHPRVLEAMMPHLSGAYGNPSATYALGRAAGDAVQKARRTVAGIIGCRPTEIVFTSGGTESINTAIKGVAFQQKKARAGNHIVTSTIEHHAVLHSCQYLERFGFEVTYVSVDSRGLVDPVEVARAVTDQTVLVSIMMANNEVGTIEPLGELANAVQTRARALGHRIPFHTDAVQAPNSISLRLADRGIDLMS